MALSLASAGSLALLRPMITTAPLLAPTPRPMFADVSSPALVTPHAWHLRHSMAVMQMETRPPTVRCGRCRGRCIEEVFVKGAAMLGLSAMWVQVLSLRRSWLLPFLIIATSGAVGVAPVAALEVLGASCLLVYFGVAGFFPFNFICIGGAGLAAMTMLYRVCRWYSRVFGSRRDREQEELEQPEESLGLLSLWAGYLYAALKLAIPGSGFFFAP